MQGRGRPHSLPLCFPCAGWFPRCDLILIKTLEASVITPLWTQRSSAPNSSYSKPRLYKGFAKTMYWLP